MDSHHQYGNTSSGEFVLGTTVVHMTPAQPVHPACSCSSQGLLVRARLASEVIEPDTSNIEFHTFGSQQSTRPSDEIIWSLN